MPYSDLSDAWNSYDPRYRRVTTPDPGLEWLNQNAPFPTLARPEPPPPQWTDKVPVLDPADPDNYGPGSPFGRKPPPVGLINQMQQWWDVTQKPNYLGTSPPTPQLQRIADTSIVRDTDQLSQDTVENRYGNKDFWYNNQLSGEQLHPNALDIYMHPKDQPPGDIVLPRGTGPTNFDRRGYVPAIFNVPSSPDGKIAAGGAPPAPDSSNYLGDVWNYILGDQTYTGSSQREDSNLVRILKNWAGPKQLPVDLSTPEGRANARVNDMLNPFTSMSKDEWKESYPIPVSPGVTKYPNQFGPLYQPRGAAPAPPNALENVDKSDRDKLISEIAQLQEKRDQARAKWDISKQFEAQRKYNSEYGERDRIAQEYLASKFPSWGGLFDPRPMAGAAGRMIDPRPLMGAVGSGFNKMHDTIFPPAY